jgi:sec-independent protein translocase protein TatA
MRLGPIEIILIVAVILVITGAAFVPSLGKSLGKGVHQLRQATGGGNKDKVKVVTKLEDDAAAAEINRRVLEQKRSAKTG